VEDPYRWLEDPDSPEVKQWVEDQNACTAKYYEGLKDVKKKFSERMLEMVR
jgi:prolyl oligopeptidase